MGTRCYILLLVGRDERRPARPPGQGGTALGPRALPRCERLSPPRHAGGGRPKTHAGATDAFLGWQRIEGLDGKSRDYYLRQLHDWKGVPTSTCSGSPGATLYARICGATLARAHARWGDRIAIAAYLGKGDRFDRAIAEFASRYADQNERDYEALLDAVKVGRARGAHRSLILIRSAARWPTG